MQVNSKCPGNCVHLGKLNIKDFNNRVHELLDAGRYVQKNNPVEAIRLFDRVLELDNDNIQALIGKGSSYSNLGKTDEALECMKRAYAAGGDPNVCISIATIYRRNNMHADAIDVLERVKERLDSWEADYILGDSYYMTGRLEEAVKSLNNVISNRLTSKEYFNKSKVLLSRIFLEMRDTDKSMEYAESIDEEFRSDKLNLIENIYLAGGRMYELLNLINSMEQVGYDEKYMLLQCSLVLKKNTHGSITAIIDDLLNSDFYIQKPYNQAILASLKITLLYKDLRLKEAYDVFEKYRDKIITSSSSIQNCREACHLIAFFLYSIDKSSAIEIYSSSAGMEVDDFIIGEIYNVFSTLELSPYIKAKSIEKSIQLVKNGKVDNFNRIMICADILYESGEYSQAFEMYKRLFDNDKPDTVLMSKAATCLIKQSKFDEALRIYNDILSHTRFIPSVYPGIIRCCIELGMDWSEYFKHLELEKLGFSEIYELAGSMMNAEYYDKAGYLYSYMLDKYNNMDIYSKKMIYHNMAGVYRNLKDYQKGIEIINKIPSRYMGEDLYIDLGCFYFDNREYLKAKEIFLRVSGVKSMPVVYFNIGIICMRLNEYESALEYFKTARDKTVEIIRGGKPASLMEHGAMLMSVYTHMSLCFIKLGNFEEALSHIEMSGRISMDEKISEIIFLIQRSMLKMNNETASDTVDIENLMDNCMPVKEGFTEDIRRLLDSILYKIYGKKEKRPKLKYELDESITSFLRNEKRIYAKYKDSVERSQGTFQRYVDNLVSSFERKVIPDAFKEIAATLDEPLPDNYVLDYCRNLLELGDNLFKTFEFDEDEHIYTSLIPYYKCIKMLCRYFLYPYYMNNINSLPIPSALDDFKNIGIFSYKAGDEVCHRIDFSFNISCSQYLFEVNCHPGLRSSYLNCKRHYMPWDKLMWMVSGIKKRWDILDDAKSAGLLLLFYCGYKNYLGVEGDFPNVNDIIKLAGDLIRVSNERDHYIRCMLSSDYEYDCVNAVRDVKETALRCIEGLMKIKKAAIPPNS